MFTVSSGVNQTHWGGLSLWRVTWRKVIVTHEIKGVFDKKPVDTVSSGFLKCEIGSCWCWVQGGWVDGVARVMTQV